MKQGVMPQVVDCDPVPAVRRPPPLQPERASNNINTSKPCSLRGRCQRGFLRGQFQAITDSSY
ncbi:MAG: hypothetical protein NVSMB6_01910 [Burkholderiaceae bacterium]